MIRKAVTSGSERSRWKSTQPGNSLAAYSTARTAVRERDDVDVALLPGNYKTNVVVMKSGNT